MLFVSYSVYSGFCHSFCALTILSLNQKAINSQIIYIYIYIRYVHVDICTNVNEYVYKLVCCFIFLFIFVLFCCFLYDFQNREFLCWFIQQNINHKMHLISATLYTQ